MSTPPSGKRENEKDDSFEIKHAPGDGHYELADALPEPGTPERIAAERKLVRKLDMRVLPTIIVIYIMNYIDVDPELRYEASPSTGRHISH
ncbi:hypothetical protein PQX77_020438 [Marasmius sp. AFHP31]|nr:hypothetical protein PQX77_020438 [Marasmius sp. AFHP31]